MENKKAMFSSIADELIAARANGQTEAYNISAKQSV
jgi:hypothetical protein